jgi:hypothetical protein
MASFKVNYQLARCGCLVSCTPIASAWREDRDSLALVSFSLVATTASFERVSND